MGLKGRIWLRWSRRQTNTPNEEVSRWLQWIVIGDNWLWKNL